jgi:5-methyltetrahydrofolate--homocysteine methyltransferase
VSADHEVQGLLQRIALCIERGKDCRDTPYPEQLRDEDGVDELVRRALDSGIDPNEVLADGLMPGMDRIGTLFGERKAFVPHLLLSARAMTKGMEHLKPYFQSGEAVFKGKLVLGVVAGDLHDIGKNLVRMMVEGAGWEVIDIGIDQPSNSFLEAIDRNPECSVGVGTLLTTTMTEMGNTVEAIKRLNSELVVVVGGAPVSENYADSIGADRFLRNAQVAREFFASL